MTSDDQQKFILPGQLEKILASLSVYYAQNDNPILQQLLVNSRYHVDEGVYYDGWDGGQWGHAIHFHVPAKIYYQIFDSLDKVQEVLDKDLNKVSKCPDGLESSVSFELQDDLSLQNWRENSGVLLRTSPASIIRSEDELRNIWKPGYLRVFLSHKSGYKKQAVQLREEFLFYGVSCFVAHEDIEPTKEWQDEIEKALFSMEVMVPLLTKKFSDSKWTDQEIGVAIGRGIPIISVKLGIDPYGFIGKYQAVTGYSKKPEDLAKELFELFFSDLSIKGRVMEALVSRFEKAETFSHADKLFGYLQQIKDVPPHIIEQIKNAYKSNSQLRNSFKVRDNLPILLKRWGKE